MKKVIAMVLVLSLALSMCVMGAGAETTAVSKEGRRVVEFWHCFGGAIGEAIQAIVDSYNASQTEVYVEATYQGAYDDTLTKLKTALPAGTGPDVFQMFELGTAYLAATDYYVPFQDLLEQDPYMSLDEVEGVLRNYYTVDGKMVCIPINPSSPIMYYNKTAFEKAGITEVPTTFDEIAAISKQLTDANEGMDYAMGLYTYGWFFENFIAGMGLNYVNNDNGHTEQATAIEFDSNGAGKAILEKWKEMVDSGVVFNFGAAGGSDCNSAFQAGQVGIMLNSTAGLTTITAGSDFEVGTAYLPKINADSEGGVIIGGANLWIVKNEDQQVVSDTWDFVKYATSADNSAAFSMATGYFAANTNAYKIDSYVQYLESHPNASMAINQLHDSPMNYATAGASTGVMTELRAIFQSVMDEYLQGVYATAEDALAAMAEQDNAAIETYNELQSVQ